MHPVAVAFGGSAITATADTPFAGAGRPDRADPVGLLARLFDTCSLRPLTPFSGEVIAARGVVAGVPVVAFVCDRQPAGTALDGERFARVVTAVDTAVADGVPLVGIWCAEEGRPVTDGIMRDGDGGVVEPRTSAADRIPSISVVAGPSRRGTVRDLTSSDIGITTGARPAGTAGAEVTRVVAPTESAVFQRARSLVSALGGPGRAASAGSARR